MRQIAQRSVRFLSWSDRISFIHAPMRDSPPSVSCMTHLGCITRGGPDGVMSITPLSRESVSDDRITLGTGGYWVHRRCQIACKANRHTRLTVIALLR